MHNIQTLSSQEAVAATLHVWRTAAHAVASDPLATRQQAYEEVIAQLCAELPIYTHLHELINHSWSAELLAIAATASLSQRGRMLNYHVVAAAACWRHLRHLLAMHIIAEGEGVSIEE